MENVWVGIVLFALAATCLALVEIESEGKHGWAEKLPTWYRTKGRLARIYAIIMAKKPLTGYHLWMFFFPIFFFHFQFAFASWSLEKELLTWAVYFAWCVLWDYHWFVMNPAYKGRFKKDYVWWHAKSAWVFDWFPVDYLVGTGFSFVLAAGAALVAGNSGVLLNHFYVVAGWWGYTAILKIIVSPYYHRWHIKMHHWSRDQRDQVDIFHQD
ncbi:MAG: hypothetical protein HYT15_02025 [Candidatus Magasanikbacteria bacterium]|nr:hypothetical protein [Candidatus Magasanikbacteria bacterium]